jgi:hypothetical protein
VSALAHNPLLEAVECECEDCRFWKLMGPQVDKYRDTKERRESLEILKAVRLAPSLEVCEALLRAEKVHASRLDPEWVKAYGRS